MAMFAHSGTFLQFDIYHVKSCDHFSLVAWIFKRGFLNTTMIIIRHEIRNPSHQPVFKGMSQTWVLITASRDQPVFLHHGNVMAGRLVHLQGNHPQK